MQEYRIYHLNKSGHIVGPPDGLTAPDDEAAVAQAKRLMMNAHQLEIWQSDRLVETLAAPGSL